MRDVQSALADTSRCPHSEAAARTRGSHAALPDWSVDKFLQQALDYATDFRPPVNRLRKDAPVAANNESAIFRPGFRQRAEVIEKQNGRVDTPLERTMGTRALRGET